MIIGVPKEIKTKEFRVGLTPRNVRELVNRGHSVLVEHNAGQGIGLSNEAYQASGARICETADQLFKEAELIVKVKEPQPEECKRLTDKHVLFTFLHLAPDPQQADLLQESGCVAIAYETVTDNNGTLPLLTPMSEVAGRLSVQAGAHCLEKAQGGRGVLLGGVPGVAPGRVVVIGGGVVGENALTMAVGLGANVAVIDKSIPRLKALADRFDNRVTTVFSTSAAVEEYVYNADLVIGAVLLPGGQAPKLVSKSLVEKMPEGSVMVDVAIDQGGCFETSRPTTHVAPTYIESGVMHYCVTNMPGAVPRTSTFALSNATLPYVIQLADQGYKKACASNPALKAGLNVMQGNITYEAVAKALNKDFVPAESLL